MKSQITAYVNEKHSATNAAEMKTAIESNGGVKGCRVAVAKIDSKLKKQKQTKWDGISLINNFQYEKDGIRMWRAFEIGPGRLLPYNDLCGNDGDEEPTGLTLVADFGKQNEGKIGKAPSVSSSSRNFGQLFPCSEPGCVNAFEDEEMLQMHFDTGKHVMHVEQESTYDRLKKNWAETLSGITLGLHSLSLGDSCNTEGQISKEESTDLMSGWALKNPKKPSRMSDSVKLFLIAIFNEGQRSGIKANPQEVAHIMKHKLNESGKLAFHPDEWRTAKQIASFFSRMSSVQKDHVTIDAVEAAELDDDDCDALVQEQEWHDMKAAVFDQLDYQHPLMYEDFNLCQLAQTNGIGKLKLKCLKDICGHFNVQIKGPKTRKDSYVNPPLDLILSCQCS